MYVESHVHYRPTINMIKKRVSHLSMHSKTELILSVFIDTFYSLSGELESSYCFIDLSLAAFQVLREM